MSIKQFQQELSKGLPSAVYLLYSSEDFLLYEALSMIKEQNEDINVFNFEVFDMSSPDDSLPAEQIVDILNTMPFMSSRKTVAIKNVQKLSKKDMKTMENYLAAPSPSSLLIMLYDGASPKLFEMSSLKNVKVISLNINGKDIPLWIKDRSKRKGIELTDRAVEYLISFIGTDLGMFSAEIEKLSSWGTGRVFDVDDIKGIVYAGVEYSAFDLVNALMNKNAKKVFRIFENVNRTIKPEMLLGALNYQFASIRSKALKSGSDREKERFREVFTLLHKADAAVKTSHNCVLEDLLFKLLRS